MSTEKIRKTKVVKEVKPDAEKQKKVRKTKSKPTKQEMLKFFQDSLNELKQIVADLNEEKMKIQGIQLKQLPLLIEETLQNLDEDMKEIEAEYKNIESMPDDLPSQ